MESKFYIFFSCCFATFLIYSLGAFRAFPNRAQAGACAQKPRENRNPNPELMTREAPGNRNPNYELTLDFMARELESVGHKHRQVFRSATPFPHAFFDNFFASNFSSAVSEEFSDETRFKIARECKSNPLVGCYKGKKEFKKFAVFDDKMFGPATNLAYMVFRSPQFVRFLERMTGIPHLVPDPEYRGSGLHMTSSGGLLEVHADFNRHGSGKPMFRRVNVFLFLNENWDESWGGHLELWSQNMSSCEKRLSPNFNRLVVFRSNDFSYHGHPQPLKSPEHRTRRSLAMYYYTLSAPDEIEMDRTIAGGVHSTLYQARPQSGRRRRKGASSIDT